MKSLFAFITVLGLLTLVESSVVAQSTGTGGLGMAAHDHPRAGELAQSELGMPGHDHPRSGEVGDLK